MNKLKILSMVLALGATCLFAAACGGEGDVGEACDTSGSEDECVDGAICDSADGDDAAVCLSICVEQEDCAADEDCNGVSGSNIKACHPKDDTPK